MDRQITFWLELAGLVISFSGGAMMALDMLPQTRLAALDTKLRELMPAFKDWVIAVVAGTLTREEARSKPSYRALVLWSLMVITLGTVGLVMTRDSWKTWVYATQLDSVVGIAAIIGGVLLIGFYIWQWISMGEPLHKRFPFLDRVSTWGGLEIPRLLALPLALIAALLTALAVLLFLVMATPAVGTFYSFAASVAVLLLLVSLVITVTEKARSLIGAKSTVRTLGVMFITFGFAVQTGALLVR